MTMNIWQLSSGMGPETWMLTMMRMIWAKLKMRTRTRAMERRKPVEESSTLSYHLFVFHCTSTTTSKDGSPPPPTSKRHINLTT